jgi:hypothetical protein
MNDVVVESVALCPESIGVVGEMEIVGAVSAAFTVMTATLDCTTRLVGVLLSVAHTQ